MNTPRKKAVVSPIAYGVDRVDWINACKRISELEDKVAILKTALQATATLASASLAAEAAVDTLKE